MVLASWVQVLSQEFALSGNFTQTLNCAFIGTNLFVYVFLIIFTVLFFWLSSQDDNRALNTFGRALLMVWLRAVCLCSCVRLSQCVCPADVFSLQCSVLTGVLGDRPASLQERFSTRQHRTRNENGTHSTSHCRAYASNSRVLFDQVCRDRRAYRWRERVGAALSCGLLFGLLLCPGQFSDRCTAHTVCASHSRRRLRIAANTLASDVDAPSPSPTPHEHDEQQQAHPNAASRLLQTTPSLRAHPNAHAHTLDYSSTFASDQESADTLVRTATTASDNVDIIIDADRERLTQSMSITPSQTPDPFQSMSRPSSVAPLLR